ncbi:MAG: alpha/beta hydrolase [Verrucomicrobiae bacterium]|nr:alpha/beta hydrolase [Verrucomicrobiae bacterium]
MAGERELTPGEKKTIEIFGPNTPRLILLWPDKPPRAIADAPPEEVTPQGRIKVISTPTISVYLPSPEKSTGRAFIICPGGGYGALDWVTHVVGSAACLVPEGFAVIGLKYRTCKPYPVSREIRDIALLDLQRAVRLVRSRAGEWNINPRKIGVVGYSAGADLTMHLASNFDYGRPDSPDPVERFSCRPDFVVGCSTWHWRESKSPYVFRRDTPPVFLVHATNDGLSGKDGRIGGAPIQLPLEIKRQLEQLGVPVRMVIFDEGGHGVGNLIPSRYKRGFPGAQWPKLLVRWLESLGVGQSPCGEDRHR